MDLCQKTFSPSDKEMSWAVRIVIADEKANKEGKGAWTLDGRMIDAPVVGKAKATVKKAELCGFNVDEIRNKWANQEPE